MDSASSAPFESPFPVMPCSALSEVERERPKSSVDISFISIVYLLVISLIEDIEPVFKLGKF